ncbi:MAG: hypothetical protein IJW22_08120 [Clostridia bacterium]|nr:hypothetical protein [Clostridia bacterium]
MYISIGTIIGVALLMAFVYWVDKREGTGLKGVYKKLYISCKEYLEKFNSITTGELAPKIKQRLLKYNNRPDNNVDIDRIALTLLYNTCAEEIATGYYHSFGDLTMMGKEIEKVAYQALATSLKKGYITQEDCDACHKDLQDTIREAG